MGLVTNVEHPRPRIARPQVGRTWVAGLSFVLPALVLVATFVYSPLIDAVRHSFTRWDGISPATGAGLDNYRFLLGSSDFHRILLNEAILICGVVVWVVVPLSLAMMLHGRPYAIVARALLFLPPLLPPVIAGSVFRVILADDGPLNGGLRGIGLGGLAQGWLTDEHLVLLSVVLVVTWGTMGTGVMLYSSALASLSPGLVEAARLEGASWRQIAWHIYRPHLRPVTRFWTLLLTVATVTAFFPWIFPLTQGGPGISSTTIDYNIWAAGIRDGQFGLASAVAVVDLVIVALLLAFLLLIRRVGARRDA